MPGKITVTSKRIGIFPLEMGVDTASSETDGRGVNTRTEPELYKQEKKEMWVR